jgi:hypothetical protein
MIGKGSLPYPASSENGLTRHARSARTFPYSPPAKEMEKKRNARRMNLFWSQDEIDIKKENLIGEIEARLKQRIEKNELFLIRWQLV